MSINCGLDFNGHYDFIDCTNNTLFDLTTKFTLEVRCKINSEQHFDNNNVISKISNDESNGWKLFYDKINNKFAFKNFSSSSSNINFSTSFSEFDSTSFWVINLVYDSSLTNNNLKFYINGILDNSSDETNSLTVTANSLNIAKYFAGIIDYVRIYDVALSQSEITNNYNGNVTTTCLIANYQLNSGEGRIATDDSSNNIDGEIIGARWVYLPPIGDDLIFKSNNFSFTTRCISWKVDDKQVTVEFITDVNNRNLLISNLIPGAIEVIDIGLGKKYYFDYTTSENNTVYIYPAYDLANVKYGIKTYCSGIVEKQLNDEMFKIAYTGYADDNKYYANWYPDIGSTYTGKRFLAPSKYLTPSATLKPGLIDS